MLADAARLGVIRHGRPEAWAAGAVIALSRANDVLGAGRALIAQQVAEELDVSVGALAVTEHELARALNLERYAHPRPRPEACSWRTAHAQRERLRRSVARSGRAVSRRSPSCRAPFAIAAVSCACLLCRLSRRSTFASPKRRAVRFLSRRLARDEALADATGAGGDRRAWGSGGRAAPARPRSGL